VVYPGAERRPTFNRKGRKGRQGLRIENRKKAFCAFLALLMVPGFVLEAKYEDNPLTAKVAKGAKG
jgi:hypothetical protein